MNVSGAGLGGSVNRGTGNQYGSTLEDWINYAIAHPDEVEDMKALDPLGFGKAWQVYEGYSDYQNSGNPNDFLGQFPQGTSMSPEQEKYWDNLIAQYNTQQAQNYQTQMRDTSYLSAGSQLQELGLSSSGVLQTGAANIGNVAAAQTAHNSAYSMKQREKLNDYNVKMGLAKTMISTAGNMASSGIYGAALGAIKNSAAALSTAAAHSGMQALAALRPEVRNQLMKDEAWRYNNSHNSGLNF